MTYLFVIIAVSVINALAVTLSYGELLLTNVIFIICIRLCENIPYLKSRSEKLVVYDRIDLIKPDCRDELLKDLKDRLGLDIIDVEVGAVDFLRDTAMLKVYYGDRKGSINTVDNMLKIPKDK